MDQRENIRNKIRAMRRRLEPAFVNPASAAIQRAALKLAEWRNAASVFCYLAMPTEVHTGAIIAECRAAKKRLFVPAFMENARKYAPALFDPGDEFGLGKNRVFEPLNPKLIKAGKIDLVFVPGLAFDRRGGRLGHGGGHYDRMLAGESMRSAFKVGLAFDFQIFKRLPLRGADVRMDLVITESNIFYV